MRALCGSIITAGALIGLGLVALGLGMRYQGLGGTDVGQLVYVRFRQLDTAMMLLLVVLLASAVAGMAATFLGLAYHHERRHYERHYRNVPGESLGAKIGE
jgi:hypothetical protein